MVAWCTCSTWARQASGIGCDERELGVRLQAGERRAQLVRGVGEEALLVAAGGGELLEQAVQRRDQRPRLLRRAAGVERVQVAAASAP